METEGYLDMKLSHLYAGVLLFDEIKRIVMWCDEEIHGSFT